MRVALSAEATAMTVLAMKYHLIILAICLICGLTQWKTLQASHVSLEPRMMGSGRWVRHLHPSAECSGCFCIDEQSGKGGVSFDKVLQAMRGRNDGRAASIHRA
jgi:hypothetical protein